MTPSVKSRPTLRSARGAAACGMSSVLRLAARGRQAKAAAPGWLDGLKQALRAAGPARGGRPLLCEFPASEFQPGR